MFGIDFSEILLIFGIALVVLGPEKLPKLANTIGRWIGRARGMARQFREQLEQESHTLRESVDLGPEFSSRPGARPGNGGTTPRPTADSSTPPPEARIDPRPMGPPAPPRPAGVAGSEPAAPMTEPPLPEMGLADTYPEAFHPYQPPPITEPPPIPASTGAPPSAPPSATASAAEAASASPAAPAAAVNGDAQSAGAATAGAEGEAGAQDPDFPAPHQTAFWPPDGRL